MFKLWLAVPLGAAFFFIGAGCAPGIFPRPGAQVTVACWNVENLFDEVADGGEYPEFDPDRGWTRDDFWGRCSALAPVLRRLGADVLVLEEVETARAAAVLADRFVPDLGYRYRFLAPPEVPGVKTVVLSRYTLVRTGLSVPAPGDVGPLRPLVEAEIDLGGRALVVVGNHWKSRIPSPEATEGQRLRAARALRRRLEALDARPDRPLVLALGDFNDDPALARSLADRAFEPLTAAQPVPGGPGLGVFVHRSTARASGGPGTVWDPWETTASPRGSYLYRGRWDRLDHIFVAASALGLADWTPGTFRVEAFAPEPQAWNPRTRQGISDHFPLVLTLVRP